MSLIWMDSFDVTGDPGQRYDSGSTTGTTTGRTGSALLLSGAGTYVLKQVPDSDTYYAGFAWRCDNQQTDAIVSFRESSGALVHVELRPTNNGVPPMVLEARRGSAGTVLATGSTPIALFTWYYIEMKVVVHDSAGVVEVRVNGEVEFSVSGVDTRNGGSGVINGIRLHGYILSKFDDYWIDDAVFHGDCKVEVVRPNGAGASTDFTPSAGSNYQNVDESTPNDDTDYNASSSPGDIDLFDLDALAITAGTVKGIQVVNRWRKDDAGSRTARRVIRTGGSNFQGSDVALSDSYVTNSEVLEENPDTTSPWTISDVNALQAGYKIEA